MRASFLTAAALMLAFFLIGCNKATAPKIDPAEKVTLAKPDWKLVTLHIEGFKKSKSGGT